MKYRLEVKLTAHGWKTTLHKKRTIGWSLIDGLNHINFALFLIEDFIQACREKYGKELEIIDHRK